MSGFFDDLPEHMKGMGMFGSGNGNPSRQMAEMMMGAVDPATGAPRPDVMARAAFAAHAVASGTMCGRDGPDEETKESAADDDGSGDDGDVPSLESMTSSEDGADDLGSEGESNGKKERTFCPFCEAQKSMTVRFGAQPSFRDTFVWRVESIWSEHVVQ